MREFDPRISQRTDLADEAAEFLRERQQNNPSFSLPLITAQNRRGFEIQTLEVNDEKSAESTGKQIGKYITVNIGRIWLSEKDTFRNACEVIAGCIREFIPKDTGASCLLAALGNRQIMADAIGPIAADNYIVTRHIRTSEPELFKSLGMRETTCIRPGVLGSTGVEAAEIVRAAAQCSDAGFVIAVDALASRRLSRLATTVQICGSGISPGSGIYNERMEISEKTLGIPVIAIGVPTVVEVPTLAMDILNSAASKAGFDPQSVFPETIREKSLEDWQGFFVTPKETDHIIKDTAKLIGYAINLALHESLDFDEIDEFLS